MDVKELLYGVINKMGTSVIHQKLSESRENSIVLIDELMNNCKMINKDKPLNGADQLALAESLMHYLLTTLMLPSQRKIKIGEIKISVIIPDLRNLNKNPEQVLFIQFIDPQSSNAQSIINALKTLQPVHDNIWLISYLPVNTTGRIKNYCISKSANLGSDYNLQFSRIIYDVGLFTDNLIGFHFKVF